MVYVYFYRNQFMEFHVLESLELKALFINYNIMLAFHADLFD